MTPEELNREARLAALETLLPFALAAASLARAPSMNLNSARPIVRRTVWRTLEERELNGPLVTDFWLTHRAPSFCR